MVAEHGYRSVVESFRENRAAYAKLLSRHGIALRNPDALPESPAVYPFRSPVASALSGSLEILGSKLRRAARA